MQFHRTVLAGAVGVSVAASYVSDANATWFRTHGAACFGIDPLAFNSTTLWTDNGYALANGENSSMELMCSVPDSSNLPRNQFRTVNVETWVAGPANSAALCEDQWNGLGGSCTNLVSTTGTGHQTIVLGGLVGTNGTWTPATTSNFGYIGINVGGEQGAPYNDIRGIFYSN